HAGQRGSVHRKGKLRTVASDPSVRSDPGHQVTHAFSKRRPRFRVGIREISKGLENGWGERGAVFQAAIHFGSPGSVRQLLRNKKPGSSRERPVGARNQFFVALRLPASSGKARQQNDERRMTSDELFTCRTCSTITRHSSLVIRHLMRPN